MVANITTPDNCKNAIDYIMAIKEEDKKSTLLLHSDGVLPTDNRTIAACLEAAAMLGDHNLKKPFGHISLDFHKYDKAKLTDEYMAKIAQDYMNEMGIKDTEFVIYRHHDKEHPHCHLVYSRVNRQGKVISDSMIRKHNIEVCKLMNQKYALHMSEGKVAVNRDRLKGPDKSKYDVLDKVIKARDNSEDWKEFESQLKQMGISLKFHYNNVTRQLMGVSFSDGSYSYSGKKLDNSLVYAELAKKFGDVHQLAHDNVKDFYNAKVADLKWQNSEYRHPAIDKAFPDFDVSFPMEHAVSHLPNAFSLMSQSDNMSEYVDYNLEEYISSDDFKTCYIPVGLMVAVALAPYMTPIAQCSGGGGGGSSNSQGWKDDDDKDKWKFRFNYKRSKGAQQTKSIKR